MTSKPRSLPYTIFTLILTLFLAACGGGGAGEPGDIGGGTQTVSKVTVSGSAGIGISSDSAMNKPMLAPRFAASIGSAISSGTVVVYNSSGTNMATGSTDENGNFTLEVKPGFDYFIKITSSDGATIVRAFISEVGSAGKTGIIVNAYSSAIVYAMEKSLGMSYDTLQSGYSGTENLSDLSVQQAGLAGFTNFVASVQNDLVAGTAAGGLSSTAKQVLSGITDTGGTSEKWSTISAGFVHVAAIKRNGTLWAWGANNGGQLGDGTTLGKVEPIQIGTDSKWKSVAVASVGGGSSSDPGGVSGTGYSIALKTDGSLWLWGGDTENNIKSPRRVGDSTDWKEISYSGGDLLLLKTDGSIWKINGFNFYNDPTPLRIGDANNWTKISAGITHYLAIKEDGSLWSWGENSSGELGNGTTNSNYLPEMVGEDKDWVEINTGQNGISFAIKSDGSLWGWGATSFLGLVGSGEDGKQLTPARVVSETGWLSIAIGTPFVYALKTDGTIWLLIRSVGISENNSIQPVTVAVLDDNNSWLQIALRHMLKKYAIRSDGTLWDGFGPQSEGNVITEVGAGTVSVIVETPDAVLESLTVSTTASTINVGETSQFTAVGNYSDGTNSDISDEVVWSSSNETVATVDNSGLASGVTVGDITIDASYNEISGTASFVVIEPVSESTSIKWVSVSSASNHTVAIKSDGSLWAWGVNNFGQLGDGTNESRLFPVRIGNEFNWIKVSSSSSFSMAQKEDGSLWMWGRNLTGQLGDGSMENKSIPVRVGENYNWKAFSAGSGHSIAVKNDGTLWTWGGNEYGQLGNGGTESTLVPTMISGENSWINVSAGMYHSTALKSNGTLWAWGDNSNGQLGNGGTESSLIPARIGNETNWFSISESRKGHTFAIKNDGSLWVWGENRNGQAGTGTKDDIFSPVRIGERNDWASASAGDRHSLAIDNSGKLWAWGENIFGQLGDGTINSTLTPIIVSNTNVFNSISAGNRYSFAIMQDNSLWGWGSNFSGQIGIELPRGGSLTPVQVETE